MASNNTLSSLSADQVIALRELMAALDACGHGGKGELKANFMKLQGWSLATLHRNLALVGYESGRKTRADKGSSFVTEQECLTIAAALHATTSKKGKKRGHIKEIVEVLRSQDEPLVQASKVNTETGEVKFASPSTIHRRLKALAMHPTQLSAPSPHVRMRTLHPNHLVEVDGSICVLFYLKNGKTVIMDESKYREKKPHHLKYIEPLRVLRMVWWEGFSGSVLVRYYSGTENSANLLDFFMWCVQQRTYQGRPIPVHGVPYQMYFDKGAANMARSFGSLLTALGVNFRAHAPLNPRATGGAESSQQIVETKFEFKLAFQKIESIEALNACAEQWMHVFNARNEHSRHGKTRYAIWQMHKPEHIRRAPSIEVMQALVTSKIETRVVNGELAISFSVAGQNNDYDVRSVPGVFVNGKVEVCINPYESHKGVQCLRVRAIETGVDEWTVCRHIEIGLDGLSVDAPVYGEGYKSLPDTIVDKRRKEIIKEAFDADTLEEAHRKKHGKQAAFGGRIDPFKPEKNAALPVFMNRETIEAVPVSKPTLHIYRTIPEAVRTIRDRIGDATPADLYTQVKAAFPDNSVPLAWIDEYGAMPAQATGTHGGVNRGFLTRVK